MHRFKLFVLSDCIIWGTIVLLATLSIVKAITYAAIPVVGWIAMIAALVGFWGITIWRFWTRHQWIKTIKYYTRQGVAVICNYPAIGIEKRQANIDVTIQAGIDFWKRIYTDSLQHQVIDSYFDGGVLVVQDKPVEWHGRGDYAGVHKIALELTGGNTMSVGLTTAMSEITFYNLIRHAVGHVVFNALGNVSHSEQESHDLMARHNYGA